MVVGLTYDLRSDYLKEGFSEEETAEFDKEETVAGIEGALQGLGYTTDRIGHLRQLVQRLDKGDRWDLVFNICEGLYGVGREAQVPALLDAYNIPYTFSDTLILALTLHKGFTKNVVRDCGIPTPAFTVVTNNEEIKSVTLPYPLFIKPVAEGTGKGINSKSKVDTPAELEKICMELLPVYKQGLIIETYLPGREFTVAIVGTGKEARCLGTMEVLFTEQAEAHGYSYINKAFYEERVTYRIVDEPVARACEEVALSAWRVLNCRDGGRVDLRLDKHGVPGFIEVNPLAGLNPVHSDLPIICRLQGIEYQQLIGMIMESAQKRSNL
ncbi:MAG: ATP-grasp domain-containing protein [Bacteroidetes bacterium]|nr:ATP-grasp domain-containing protein [Bacteroidota bacterium]